MSESHTDVALRQTVIAGGSTGNHTVSGITTNDVLKAVNHLVGDGTQLTGAVNDLTDEFSIDSDDTIDNTGGTDTTNGVLIVTWIAADPDGEDLNRN